MNENDSIGVTTNNETTLTPPTGNPSGGAIAWPSSTVTVPTLLPLTGGGLYSSFNYPAVSCPVTGSQASMYGSNSTYPGYATNTSHTFNSSPNTKVVINESGMQLGEDCDIKIGNQSLKDFMATIGARLAILQPDPAKLEKFAALKQAYEQYKTLEALCQIDDTKDQK